MHQILVRHDNVEPIVVGDEAFEEAAKLGGTTLDAKTGKRFWNEILAVGGSRPALESFRAFRGRDPRPDALLRHSGMAVPA